MNTSVNQNLAHESESQRQYARIKIPARLIVEQNGTVQKYPLLDLSAGGFAVKSDKKFESVNGCKGRLEFNVEGFVFVVPIQFDVKLMGHDGRIGCSFQNISTQEASSLRHIITAFLSGELVTAGDMINILSRDNFAKVRAKKSNKALEGFDKLKAVIGSVLFFLVGLAAFSFIAIKLWSVLFLAHSSVAAVDSNVYSIKTPKEGIINVLFAKGSKVEAGQVIATFASPLATFLNAGAESSGLTAQSAQPLLTESYLGSLVSPCDCIIESVYTTNGEYVEQGGLVLTLASEASAPFVSANFPASDIKYLSVGKPVNLNISGLDMSGEVANFFIEKDNNGHFLDVVKVVVRSDNEVLKPLVGLPATVSFSKFDLPQLLK